MTPKTLFIWSDSKKEEVYTSLAPVLKLEPISLECSTSLVSVDENVGIIFGMGALPVAQLSSNGLIPKNRTITSLRSVELHIPVNGLKIPFRGSYSPGIMMMDYAKYVDLLCDFRSVIRYLNTGSFSPKEGNYKYVDSFADLISDIEKRYESSGVVEVGLDLETIGLDEFLLPTSNHPGAYIVTIQASASPGTSDVTRFVSREHEQESLKSGALIREQLEYLLTSPKVSIRGANLKFDLRWIWRRANLHCTNFKFDTTLVGSLLDENRSNGLDVHAKIYTGVGGYSDTFDKSIDKSRMDLVPPQILLPYAGGDADATLQVSIAQKQELLSRPSQARFYVNLLHPAARAFEIVERGGVFVDINAFNELESDLNVEVLKLVGEAKKVLGGKLVAKHYDPDKRAGLNLTKASLIVDFMFSPNGLNLKPKMMTESGKSPATSMEHLLMFKDVPEAKSFIEVMSSYSGAVKTLSTYVVGFKKHIRSDGRLHPSYYFFAGNRDTDEGGTNTGRLSCKDPAWQTLPKHTKWAKRIRGCYPAPEGFLVAELDYQQGELKVIACVADETEMIRSYRAGLDLHVVTSSRFAGYSYEDMMVMKKEDKHNYDEIRQLGKAGNFGLIYGMSADGFVEYAATSYGVHLPLSEATLFRNGFFETYPGLVNYHTAYKNFARRNKYVESPLGRVRHLPLISSSNRMVASSAERHAINSPIQSTLSDMMIWSISNSVKEGWNDQFPCFGACHDAGYRYIPENHVVSGLTRSLHSMEELDFSIFGWEPQLKFNADAKIGINLAELKDWSRP